MSIPSHKRQISKDEIAALIGPVEKPVIFEIGCNDGTDTLEFLAKFPAATVHCFDCEPRAIERFKTKVPSARAILYETAVGNHDGSIQFWQSGGTTQGAHLQDWDLSGSIHRPTGHLKRSRWCTFNSRIQVPITKLDTWLGRHPEIAGIDFMWVDVQGAEHDLIQGGRKLLKRARYFLAEFDNTPQYEGQHNCGQLMSLLGPDWELLAIYDGINLLAKNHWPKTED